jgi:hypothetical protein
LFQASLSCFIHSSEKSWAMVCPQVGVDGAAR